MVLIIIISRYKEIWQLKSRLFICVKICKNCVVCLFSMMADLNIYLFFFSQTDQEFERSFDSALPNPRGENGTHSERRRGGAHGRERVLCNRDIW